MQIKMPNIKLDFWLKKAKTFQEEPLKFFDVDYLSSKNLIFLNVAVCFSGILLSFLISRSVRLLWIECLALLGFSLHLVLVYFAIIKVSLKKLNLPELDESQRLALGLCFLKANIISAILSVLFLSISGAGVMIGAGGVGLGITLFVVMGIMVFLKEIIQDKDVAIKYLLAVSVASGLLSAVLMPSLNAYLSVFLLSDILP